MFGRFDLGDPIFAVIRGALFRANENQSIGMVFPCKEHQETGMRCLLIVAAVSAAIFFGAEAAEAQNYPWCAQYGGTPSAPTNCGFVTFQQCLATISGIGGFCVRNNMYQPPPGPHASTKAQRRHPY
jgi:hypothetical protein